jgi:hypothetical protein
VIFETSRLILIYRVICVLLFSVDLDMTTGLFTDLLDQGENGLDVGRVGITWKWV